MKKFEPHVRSNVSERNEQISLYITPEEHEIMEELVDEDNVYFHFVALSTRCEDKSTHPGRMPHWTAWIIYWGFDNSSSCEIWNLNENINEST